MAINKLSRILIVGQGIAGTILHRSLSERKIDAEVVALDLPGNASAAAAGIINPVTGPKYLKSWKYEELMDVFIPFYNSLENMLNIDFFYKMKMFRFLPGLNQINKWIKRSDAINDARFYGEFQQSLAGYRDFDMDSTWAEIHYAFRVDINLLIKVYQKWLSQENLLHKEIFSFLDLNVSEDKPLWKGIPYDLIIFAEGYRLKQNPFFSYLPLIPAKGEAILINGSLQRDFMAKRNDILTSWDIKYDWYGATLDNNFNTIEPSEEALEALTIKYEDDFGSKPKVVNQLSGIRPTVSDRRPLIGGHPEIPRLYVFNGLGTKGTSLAPLMAKYLVDHFITGEEIPPEVNIARFKSLYT